MVGLVLVSHSAKLAKSLTEMIKQVTPTSIPVAAAGGIADNPELLGTDANQIKDAIESVYTDDGVLVLMDMGSAILSTELAIDFFDERKADKIKICSGPIVEGAISAAAQISINSSLEKVMEEALEGLHAKQVHLNEAHEKVSNFDDGACLSDSRDSIKRVFTIKNIHGLHARPAAKFVQLAGTFKNTNVQISNITRSRGPVSAVSLNRIATLGVCQNDQVLVSASGEYSEDAMKALETLIDENFGESISTGKKTDGTKRKNPDGIIPVSEGIAFGNAYIFGDKTKVYPKKDVSDYKKEIHRFLDAVNKAREEIDRKRRDLSSYFSKEELAIFEAHFVLLQDPELIKETEIVIEKEKCNAEHAWDSIIRLMIKNYENLEDAYMQLRGNDLRDVGNQVLEILSGEKLSLSIDVEGPVILFAPELTPTETATLDLKKVQGIITKHGGATSHTAIFARALGIPAICGYPNLSYVKPNEPVILDGFTGKVYVNPDDKTRESLVNKKNEWIRKREELMKIAQGPAVTVDGRRIEIMANIGSVEEVSHALKNGAEGIGLLRTEFLFLERHSAPSEEEQYQKLKQIMEPFGERSVTVRTLDIGGDKQIPYLPLPFEENPFLGVRGVRLYQENMELFIQHIRAILRAGEGRELEIMFPMISQVEEFHATKKIVEDIHKQLETEQVKHAWPVKIGVMIETPSAVIMANELAKAVDFFSIGTNDLTQYVMAAERGNPALNLYTDPLHPSVLRSIRDTAEAAHKCKIKVSICGEMGGDTAALPITIGLNIDKLSMNSPKIPEVKQRTRLLDSKIISSSMDKILSAENASSVRKMAKNLFSI